MPSLSEMRRHEARVGRTLSDAELREEPNLNDMLEDPVMQTLMRRDGVTRLQILSLMVAFRERRIAQLKGRSRLQSKTSARPQRSHVRAGE